LFGVCESKGGINFAKISFANLCTFATRPKGIGNGGKKEAPPSGGASCLYF